MLTAREAGTNDIFKPLPRHEHVGDIVIDISEVTVPQHIAVVGVQHRQSDGDGLESFHEALVRPLRFGASDFQGRFKS